MVERFTLRSKLLKRDEKIDPNAGFEAFIRQQSSVSEAAVSRASKVAAKTNGSLAKTLVSLGLHDEEEIKRYLADFQSLTYCSDASTVLPDSALCQGLDLEQLRRAEWVPLETESETCSVLLTEPENAQLLREIAFYLNRSVAPVVGSVRTVHEVIAKVQTPSGSEIGATGDLAQAERDLDRIEDLNSDGPTIRFVQSMLSDALDRRASDVHIERAESGLRIRFRIQGNLEEQPIDRPVDPEALVSRIKVLAHMNVAEKRLPQDGRIGHVHSGRHVDIRVSSVPTQFGESLVCRLLDPGAISLDWNVLGFDGETVDQIKSILASPNGLFLVTGPTGSGKTTTLYTCLKHLASETRKIITVEDPIEYSLTGIEQVPVDGSVGLSFATVLRSVLRQDPDIIMVGEIRDPETAEIACRAAMVGRLVLSTLHTNSAQDAPRRLKDLGVPDYMVENVLRATLGQTLRKASKENVANEVQVPLRADTSRLKYEFVKGV